MSTAKPKPKIIIVPADSLPSQPWWPELHSTIIKSFLNKSFSAFPPTWTRLNPVPAKGAEGLAQELGDNGHIAVVFIDDSLPIACGGVLPYRGDNWIDEIQEIGDVKLANGEIDKSEHIPPNSNPDSIANWELCCFCVHPSYRVSGLSYALLDELIAFLKPKGAKRLLTNYSIEESGKFWPRLGFEVIPGAGGVLRKGFKADLEKEGLREDIHFDMGAKIL